MPSVEPRTVNPPASLTRRAALRRVVAGAATLAAGLPAVPAGASAVRATPVSPGGAARSGAAGSGGAGSGGAAGSGGMMVLLSDPHIDADPGRTVRGAHLSGNLRLAVSHILEGDRPAGVLVNGDCAYSHGDPGSYVQFARLLEPLRDAGLPVHLTLGNHDDRQAAYDAFPDSFGVDAMPLRRCVGVVERPDADWYRLDSLRKTDETRGELGDPQLRWLAERLDANPDRPAVIVVHHPPDDPERGRRDGLDDTFALLHVLRQRPQVKALFYGHLHRFDLRVDAGLHLIGLPATAYAFQFRQPPGYVEARLTEGTLHLTRRCLDETNRHHGTTHRLTLR